MALIDEVKRVCRGLDEGWVELLDAFGLDVRATNLAAALAAPLPKLRAGRRPNVAGFEDLDPKAVRGIEPGIPDRSLLYHALASPSVRRRVDGRQLRGFPTLRDLEAVENYVFGVRPPTLATLRRDAERIQAGAGARLAIVVFAYEYRPGGQTVHETWAGAVFSRTGVARVGTANARYSGRERGFEPTVPGNRRGFCVLPARYAAYIAFEHRGPAVGVFGPHRSERGVDRPLRFWVPLHKLFSGRECIRGLNLTVSLAAHHLNDKLARLHRVLGPGNTNLPNPDLDRPPFTLKEGIAELSRRREFGEGVLVPVLHETLVERAELNGRLVGYRVPADANTLSSSYAPIQATETDGARLAPEYVHARHRLRPNGSIDSLNDLTNVAARVEKGDYTAVHYIDFTGDGWIEATCDELPLEKVAAYSLVTAPDFFFSTSQRDLMDWTSDPDQVIEPIIPAEVKNEIWRIDPSTLSDVQDGGNGDRFRLPPNVALDGSGFRADDKTVSALVGLPLLDRVAGERRDPREPNRHAHLPDAASGVFEPGWDVSLGKTDGVLHLAAFGLGSPFPEDAKLCAALSAFWPAVAPDAARIYEPRGNWRTVAPLTDEEIGIVGNLPYDGYPGPRLLRSGTEVEYQSFAHADYVESAFYGRFTALLTSQVAADEYKNRVAAMARVYRALGARSRQAKAKWAVLSFRAAVPEEIELKEGEREKGVTLTGTIRRFEVYEHGKQTLLSGGKVRVRVRRGSMKLLYLDSERILIKTGRTWELK